MSIRTRQTKDGIIYDARYRLPGSLKHVSKRFSRKSDAREFLAKIQGEQLENRHGFASTGRFEDMTLNDEAQFWLEQMRVQLSDGWMRRASGIISKDLVPRYGHLTLDRFTIPFIRRMQGELKESGSRLKNKELANASVNRITEVLCAILNYSAKTRRIPFNPAKGYVKLPDDRMEIGYWEGGEVQDFLLYLSERFPKGHDERWVYVAMLVALNCGLRAGELWGLMPGDIKEETLYIKRQWLELEKRFDLPKGKRNRKAKDRLPYRHTVLHKMVREELLAIVAQRQVRSDQTIFYGESGNPRGHRSFAHRFDRMVKDWGGKRIRFHDLRHTAITLWVHAGVNLKVIQEMAGHENVLTTMGYVHMVGGSVNRVSSLHLVSEKSEPRLLSNTVGKDDFSTEFCGDVRRISD
ncbi:MAG: tyrosine-type recombinase/integrase [Bdellovibrionales bacterium]